MYVKTFFFQPAMALPAYAIDVNIGHFFCERVFWAALFITVQYFQSMYRYVPLNVLILILYSKLEDNALE